MKYLALFLFLLTGRWAAFAQTPVTTAEPKTEIVLDQASSDIFPENWLDPKINATAALLPQDDRPRCQEILVKALKKYPAAVLDANLKKVYVVEKLQYSGISAGGTNSRDNVYVLGKSRLTPDQIENIFHAEFSSILLRNFPIYLDQTAWQQLNPIEFHYRGNGVEAVRNNQASQKGQDSLLEEGFMEEYAEASVEEDFNSFTGRLFVGDAQLWDAVEKHPKIKAKLYLVLAFYAKLDSEMTLDFFQSLRQHQDA